MQIGLILSLLLVALCYLVSANQAVFEPAPGAFGVRAPEEPTDSHQRVKRQGYGCGRRSRINYRPIYGGYAPESDIWSWGHSGWGNHGRR